MVSEVCIETSLTHENSKWSLTKDPPGKDELMIPNYFKGNDSPNFLKVNCANHCNFR